jgi:signal transduction histidine kinase
MNRGSLRLRLFLAGAVSILVALTLSAVGLPLLFERHVERRIVAELGVYLDQIVAGIDRTADGTLAVVKAPAEPRFSQPFSGLYWQVEADGETLRSRSLWDTELALPAPGPADGAVHQLRVSGPRQSELVVIERSVILPARLGGLTIRAIVALDTTDITTATRGFAVDLLPYLAVIAVFLMAAAYAQVTVGLWPLAAVRERLAAIRQGAASRLGQAFPDEIQPLAAEVDALLEAREAQIDRARARAGDLAHGLKTPLQVLSGDVERLREKGEEGIAAEVQQVATTMRRHVDRELARARSAAGAADARAVVADVVSHVLAVITRTPDGARLDWSIDIPAETVARIDADDLAEAIGNLIENAARHGRAQVAIGARRKDDLVIVSVTDDGPGIPDGRLEEALARGGRLDRLGTGTGLGLAIVRDIAEAWGGHLEIRSSQTGLTAEFGVKGAT